MNANATVATRAASIATVKAVVKRGENVLSAYMLSSIRFELLVVVVVGGFGSARLFSFCSSVVNRNEWGIASSRYACTIRTEKKGVKFFFNFFFRWVWARGCGRVGVGAWVWARGSVGGGRRDGDGRARDDAGWIGIVAVGWARIASLGLPNPDSDWRLGCDG